MALTLTAIHRYPVKSLRGEQLSTAVVEPWGLAGDRRWMVVDGTGEAVTAREQPGLLLARPSLIESGLRVSAAGRGDLLVPIPADADTKVTVFGRAPLAACSADPAAHAWFSDLLGQPVRLVYQDDPRRRALNPEFSADGDSAAFQDGYPLLLASEDSLAALNQLIALGRYPHQGPLPMRRFRPNLVVAGAPAWDEDHWRRLRIGQATFRVVKGCARCIITITDPDTAERGREPLASLARHRRWDGAAWFAMNLIPDAPGAVLEAGAEAIVLERAESDGPPR